MSASAMTAESTPTLEEEEEEEEEEAAAPATDEADDLDVEESC